MSKSVKAQDLGAAIERELTVYHKNVVELVNDHGRDAIEKLVKKTKANAPVGARGSFKRHITSTEREAGRGMKEFVWHVKAPDHRLTHLLVHGHATKDGGRTKGSSFLYDALEEVKAEYEKNIEEAVRNG